MNILNELDKTNNVSNSFQINFSEINSMDKVIEACKKGLLKPMYIMPLRFNGKEISQNTLYVPEVAVMLKDSCDDIVEELLNKGRVNGYEGIPEYKGNSLVPSKLTIVTKMESKPIFTETINIW